MSAIPLVQATAPTAVVKRDGRRVPFDAGKIESAIARAGVASSEFAADEAHFLTLQAVKVLAHARHAAGVPDIERIQDVVEQTLIGANHMATARAYIVYREQHKRLREDRRTLVDVGASVTEYLDRLDWRVNANANQGYSLGGLILNTSGKIIANYWLNHVYPPEIGNAHRDGDIHVHDLDMLSGYCAGWSLRTLLAEGLERRPGQGRGRPAQAHVERGRADRQLPRHAAERVGGGPGLQLVRHLHGALRAQGRPELRAGAAVHPGADLQPQRTLALGHPDALHQPDLRLGLPGGPARAGAGGRRPGDALHLRRAAGRDGPDQPRLHRGDDQGRRQGPGVHLPDPHLQRHARLPLGERERRAAVHDDGQVRPALLPELPELRARAEHGPVHVLPAAARPARAAEARQRPVRLGRADRLDRRGHPQLRAPRPPLPGRRGRPARAASTSCSSSPATAWRSSARSSSA